MRRRKAVGVGATFAAVALVAAGCVGSGDDSGSVEIVGAIGGANASALQAEAARLSELTGLNVTYTTLPDFDTVIQSRVRGGNPPDIALFPQPGLMLDLASSGEIAPLDDHVDVAALSEQMIPGLTEIGVRDGQVFGLPASINVKSLVWYPVPEFEDAGYQIPASHQELVQLTEQIRDDGTPPWCFAFEAQAATGWYVTDWIEEYVLRIGGPEVYDQWVSNEIPFNDPVVVQAGEAFEELVLAPGNAVLSRSAMAATRWEDAMQPLVADPAGCFMARQGNFIVGFWPPEVQSDVTSYVDTFLLPPYEGGFDGQPVLGGGDLVAIFDQDNEDVRAVVEQIFTPEFGQAWASTEGSEFLSPFPAFDSSNYLSEATGLIAQNITNADVFRFDGSDAMPGQVGTGTFWTQMTAWVVGQVDLETALANIEASWP